MSSPFLAVDWGTTRVRAWVIDDGVVQASWVSPSGVSRLQAGDAAAHFTDVLRPRLGAETMPAILCGMIGSNLGWTPVPYLDAPLDLASLGEALHPAPGAERAWIVPGVRGPGVTGAPDVMRGEETQALGWLAGDPARARGRHVLCLPGTHAKWVLVEDGRLERFVTAMTGELFDVLSHHSVLRVEHYADDAAAFLRGVEAAGDGGALAARLFSARSRVVGGGAPAAEAASYLSGLLIGAEITGVAPLLSASAETLILIGEPALCAWYGQALDHLGQPFETHDGGEAVRAGLAELNDWKRP